MAIHVPATLFQPTQPAIDLDVLHVARIHRKVDVSPSVARVMAGHAFGVPQDSAWEAIGDIVHRTAAKIAEGRANG